MEQKNLIIIALLLAAVEAYGQNIVEYDFETKNLQTVKPVNIGENSIFRITNINKFLYEVKIKSSQSEFTSEPPGVFSTIFNMEKKEVGSVIGEIEVQKNIIQDNEYLTKTTELYTSAGFVNKTFNQLEEAKTMKNKLIQISLTDGLSCKKAIESLKELQGEYPFSLRPETLFTSFQTSYRNFETTHQLYSINKAVKAHFKDDSNKIRESTNELVNEIEDIKKKVDEYDYTRLFQGINQLFSELKNENNYFVTSDPVQAKKDIINYNIKITPRKDVKSASALENHDFNVEVPVKGGVKIDFSTGLFITTGLHDRKYSTSLATDTTKTVIKEDKNNSIAQLIPGALMQVSWRLATAFKPGFAFGLGLNSTDLNNINVFVGVCGIFGSYRKFIVSTGFSLANVDYLKGKYSLINPINNTEIENDLTEKSIRAGCFIGFTYNLTNNKEE